MTRKKELRTRRSAAQLQALTAVQREIRHHDPSGQRKYLKEFSEAFRSYQSVLAADQLKAEIHASDIVLVGDYHALAVSQRFVASLIEERAQPGDRAIVLGVETIFSRDQHILDEWWRHQIEEPELRRRIRFDLDWGYDWAAFYELLLSAREHGNGVYGLDCMPRESLRKIGARDRHAAAKLSELRQRHPMATMVVLFGESHLAPGHLPLAIREALPNERVLTILQNVDPLYWRAAGEDCEQVDAVKVSDDVVCVFNSTPLEKYESYRLHLTRWSRDGDELDLAPTIYNLLDSLMRFLEIDPHSSHGEGQPKFLVDLLPEIRCVESSAGLSRTVADQATVERRVLLHDFEERGSVYVPQSNAVYVREFHMVYAAEDAARFLHHACRGLPAKGAPQTKCTSADRFFGRVIENALGYLGSCVLYPPRALSKGADWPVMSPSDDGENFVASTELLGYMLGNALYDAYLQGRFTPAGLRRIFVSSLEEPGAATRLYRELSGRLKMRRKVRGKAAGA
jgi:hypothetical protein